MAAAGRVSQRCAELVVHRRPVSPQVRRRASTRAAVQPIELLGCVLSARDRATDGRHAAQLRLLSQLPRHRADGAQAIQPPMADEQQLHLQPHAVLLPDDRRFREWHQHGRSDNYDLQNGRDSSGLNGPRWLAKASAMYALPWGMSAAGFYNVREGLQFNRTIQSPNRTGSLGTVNVSIEPQGTTHYPTFQQLDAHWDKTFRFDKRRFSFNVDAFNLVNASIVLARITRQDASNGNYISTILAPRIVRFGLKVNF